MSRRPNKIVLWDIIDRANLRLSEKGSVNGLKLPDSLPQPRTNQSSPLSYLTHATSSSFLVGLPFLPFITLLLFKYRLETYLLSVPVRISRSVIPWLYVK